MPAHDEALAGDTLYTIRFNFEWRKIIAAALESYFRHGYEDLALDNDDLFNNLLIDFYNAETFVNRIFRVVTLDFGSNRTTTSTTPVQLTGSVFQHTFTYKNAIIRCYGLTLNNSVGGNSTLAFLVLEGELMETGGQVENKGTVSRPYTLVAQYNDVPVDVELDISISWFVTAGTGGAVAASVLIVEIEEWD